MGGQIGHLIDTSATWPNVWCECSSKKSAHCSKVHIWYHPRIIGPGSFTRRPVWTRRASHSAPPGRPRDHACDVTCFGYSYLWNVIKSAGRVFWFQVRRDPDFCVELDETRSLHPPSRPPRTFKTALPFVRTTHDAHPIAHVKAPHRPKSLRCSSETENDIREGIIMNYAPYLAAIRGEHVLAAARSIGAALIELPVLEKVRCSREGNSEMG